MGLTPPEKCCLDCDKESGMVAINIYDAGFLLCWICYAISVSDNSAVKDGDKFLIWLVAIAAGVVFVFMLFSLCKKNTGGLFKLYFWVRFICIIAEPALIFLVTFNFRFGLQLCILLTFIFGLNFYYQWFMIHGIQ